MQHIRRPMRAILANFVQYNQTPAQAYKLILHQIVNTEKINTQN